MARERWGTFSVIDHQNPSTLVPEVLLYDRLVLPVPPNDEERQRWHVNGWAPDLLDKRLEQLGDLAVRANWDLDRQREFQRWMDDLKQVAFDAAQMSDEAKQALPYQMTRMILAQSQPNILPQDVTSVVTVAAYPSEADFRTHFILNPVQPDSDRATLGLLLGNALAVPQDADPEKALLKAIELSQNDDNFRENRRKLYAWQDQVIRENIPPQQAFRELVLMVEAYNRSVEKAARTIYYKFAFAIATAALALAAAPLGSVAAGASALCAVVQFATLDSKPVVDAGENAPAAMFHDIQKVGLWHG